MLTNAPRLSPGEGGREMPVIRALSSSDTKNTTFCNSLSIQF